MHKNKRNFYIRKKERNSLNQKIKYAFRSMNPLSIKILRFCSPLVTLHLVAIALITYAAYQQNPRSILYFYAPALEYSAMSMLIVIAVSLLFDLWIRYEKK